MAARELGGYRAYGDDAWNDELLVTEVEKERGGKGPGRMGLAEPKHMVESILQDARVRAVEGKDGAAVEVQEGDLVHGENADKPLARWTDADRRGDVRRLDRQLARTLYLVVKREGGGWGFPAGELIGRENLHQVCYSFLFEKWKGGGANGIIGCGESPGSDSRHQHEYLDRRPRPRRTSHHQPTLQSRVKGAGEAGYQDVLYEGTDYGWAGESGGEHVWADGFQVVDEAGSAEACCG